MNKQRLNHHHSNMAHVEMLGRTKSWVLRRIDQGEFVLRLHKESVNCLSEPKIEYKALSEQF